MRLITILSLLVFILSSTSTYAGSSIKDATRIEPGLSADAAYNYSVVGGVVRRGKKSQRFELRHGDCRSTRGWDDCANDRQRVERAEHPQNRIQRAGKQAWYGWSIRLDEDFHDVSPANTTIGQVKMQDWSVPLWHINLRNDVMNIWFDTGGGCEVSHISKLRGRWQDIVIFADYSLDPTGNSFLMYMNGIQVCGHIKPMVTKKMLNTTNGRLDFKYGIYNSFVSKWLNNHKTQSVKAKSYKQSYKDSSGKLVSSDSITATPFKYDWGIKLPTQVIHYDEMRFGSERKDVDILRHEVNNISPVD